MTYPAPPAQGTTTSVHPQLRTTAIAVIVVLVFVAVVAAALMGVAYWRGEDDLILPAAGVAVVALLLIHPVRRHARG